MKNLLTIVCLCLGLSAFSQNPAPFVKADDIVNNLDTYLNQYVETEGKIVHYCGVDGKKMMLKTADGQHIKLVPADFMESYDTAFRNKTVHLMGRVKEERVYATTIDTYEENQELLCSIDGTPCKDEAWKQRKRENGTAEETSKKSIAALRKKMKDNKKTYVSYATISTVHIFLKEN